MYLSADPESEATRDDPGFDNDDLGLLTRRFSKTIKKCGSFHYRTFIH